MHNHFMCVCICLCPWRAELCIKGLAHGDIRLSGARETDRTEKGERSSEGQTSPSYVVHGTKPSHVQPVGQISREMENIQGKQGLARFIYEGWQSTKSGDVSGRSCDFCKQHKANPIEGDQRHKQGSHIFLTRRQHPQIRG